MRKILIFILIAAAYLVISGMNLRPAYAQLDCSPSNLPKLSAKDQIKCGACDAAGASDAKENCSSSGAGVDSVAKFVLNLLSTIAGVAAVVMIIVSGLKYVTSSGDAEKVKSAKRTLLFAVIGLAIVALTQTIVHFVLTEATSTASTSSNTPGGGAVSPGAANSPH